MGLFSNDHYVPQFLLRNFAESGKVCVFDITTGRNFRTNPKNIMSENGYNSVKLKDGAWVEFEDKFTYIENLAKPTISKIIRNSSISILDDMEYATILTFVVIQHLRSRASRNAYLSIPAEIRRRFPEVEANDLSEFMDDDEFDKFAFLRGTLEDLASFVAPLVEKPVVLMHRADTLPLYISDNPLVMYNRRDMGPYGNIGLAVPGVEIYLPLSPDLVLAVLCSTSLDEMEKQISQAKVQVESSSLHALKTGRLSGSALDQIKEARRSIIDAEAKLATMRTRGLAPLNRENLLYLNSLQIQHASRYIVATSSDFDFARQVIAEHPEWIEPPKITF